MFSGSASNRLDGVTLNGELHLYTYDYVELYGGTTFTTARLTNHLNGIGTLAFEPGATIPGDILVDSGNSREMQIIVDGTGTLTIPAGVTISSSPSNSSADLYLGDAGDTIINEGAIRAVGGLVKTLAGSFTNNGVILSDGVPFAFANDPTNFSADLLTGGSWMVRGGGGIQFGSVNTVTEVNATLVLDGSGSSILTGAASDALASFATVGASGDFTLSGGRNLTSLGPVTNEGALRVESGSTLTVVPGESLVTRSVLDVSGNLIADSVFLESGILEGSGSISGTVVAQAGSTVSPGNSPGILNVNDFSLLSGATLNIETGGTSAGTDYDQLNVTGSVTLAGNLDVDIINTIVKGTQFTIISNDDIDPVVGTFAGLPEGATLDNGYDEYSITYVGGDGNDVVLTALTDVRAVTNTLDAGAGSLRGALIAAAAISDPVAVIFLIPGTGPYTISPASALPVIDGQTFVDATTQFGYSGTPLVEVTGAATTEDGFRFEAGSQGSSLRGLAINQFPLFGVQVYETSEITIAGNYIGTDLLGSGLFGHSEAGIDVYDSRDVVIGGPNPDDGNVISGNMGAGVRLRFRTSGTIVEGNYIGTSIDGAGDVGNVGPGILIESQGGSANAAHHNFIGQVGGAPNVISGNDQQGVLIREFGVTGNQVVNNLIGLTADGIGLLPNSLDGVLVTGTADGNTIGLAGAGNVLAGTTNPYAAIRLETSDNVVQGNSIGLDATGTVTLGGYQGIKATAPNNLIGGKSFGDGNTIRGMTAEGFDGVRPNFLLGNTIFDSGALGIDNDPDGATDLDAPIILLAVSGLTSTQIGGIVPGGVPNSTFRIEVFSSPTANVLTGVGEGKELLGVTEVTTGASGSARFYFSTPKLVPVGHVVSATSTQGDLGTSEFALSVQTRPSLLVTNTNDSGAGSLRQAIIDANSDALLSKSGDLIEFDIAGAGPHTITVATGLPTITDLTVIDGRSEPDFASSPVVEVTGSGVLGTGINLQPGADGSVIAGMAINGFTIRGLLVGAADVAIQGNYIGVSTDGTTRASNDWGIQIFNAPGTIVGGTEIADRNVISGNDSEGVRIDGSGSLRTQVLGNYLGTTAAGDAALANFRQGVNILGAPDTRVAGNLISGNLSHGIQVSGVGATNTVIQGNLIGTDAAGMVAIGNSFHGVNITSDASNTLVGTDADGVDDAKERNVIAASAFSGVMIDSDANHNVVAGNFLGTNILGTAALGNDSGVRITFANNNTIGGSVAASRNLISGNVQYGIDIVGASATDNKIFGNYIGLDVTGTAALANLSRGILVRGGAAGNFIGTDGDGVGDASEGNVIAGNGVYDIQWEPTAGANVLAGNYVGTDKSGLVSLSNTTEKVLINSDSARIGTDADGTSDILERNVFAGTVRMAATNSMFSGNLVGVGPDETTALGNPQTYIEGLGHTIGGTAMVQRNYFVGNVEFQGASTVDFQNNYVGVLPDGVTHNSSSLLRLFAGAASNVIGGPAAGEGNLITRVEVVNVGTNSNTFEGNLIGTNAQGTDGLGINAPAVVIESGASVNFIGTVLAGNVISTVKSGSPVGSDMHGVVVRGFLTADNSIFNNLIGLNLAGNAAIGNQTGIVIEDSAARTLVGGFAGAGNVISGNVRGIEVNVGGGADTSIVNNRIGTDSLGIQDIGNESQGVYIIGGTSGTTLNSNLISGNDGGGIQVGNGTAAGEVAGVTMIGNLIGTNVDGSVALGNAGFGIKIAGGLGVTIGSGAVGDRNVVSGNAGPGILVDGSSFANSGNTIQRNYIGVNGLGTSGIPNTDGIVVVQSGPLIIDNLISGNSDDGIDISGDGPATTIQGNIIGLDHTGKIDFGSNADNGIEINNSPGNTIGGITIGQRNIISGNDANGIFITGALSVGNVIQGNFIGTDITGTLARGNTDHGIVLGAGVTNTVIGTDGNGSNDAAEGNVISGNGGDGVAINGAVSTTIAGNRIGSNGNGNLPLPNNGNGVSISSASPTTIGGAGGSLPNTIAFNQGAGIAVISGSGVTARGNAIFENGALGIDLYPVSVTVNDADDTDVGANNLQNFPFISAALSGSTTTVTGSLTSLPNATYQIDFYASDSPDGSSFGQGQRHLGSTSLVLDGSGTGAISVSGLAATLNGEFVTATATDAAGNTSEFSLAQPTTSAAPPTILRDSLLVTVIDGVTEEASFGLPTLTVDEGDLLFLTGDFADADSSVAVSIDWGDGQISTDPVIREESFTGRHVYADDDPSESPFDFYRILVRVTDTDGSGAAVIRVRVNNVPAEVNTFGFDADTITEGQVATLTGTISDPGSGDIHRVEIDWGDGGGNETILIEPGQRTFSLDHTYDDDGDFAVQFSVFDDDRDPGLPEPREAGFVYDHTDHIRVLNSPPSATINAEASAVEGQSLTISATVSDAGAADTFSYVWLVELDGKGVASSRLPSFQFRPRIEGIYNVSLVVSDDDHASFATATTISVTNDAPTIRPEDVTITVDGVATSSVDEGTEVSLAGVFHDSGLSDIHELRVDFGDGSDPVVSLVEFGDRSFKDIRHTYVDDPAGVNDNYLITVTMDDGTQTSTAVVPIEVRNVDPIVSLRSDRVTDATVRLVADIQDAGIRDTHTIEWFVNGTPVPGSNVVSVARPTDAPLSILFRATDDDGGTGTVTAHYFVLDDADNTVTISDGVGGQVSLVVDGKPAVVFMPADQILIASEGGDDVITVDPNVTANVQVDAGAGDDRIVSSSGNDTLIGGSGSDTLIAGAGNDVLDSTEGNDLLDGGSGDDEYRFHRFSDKTLVDTQGIDTLNFSAVDGDPNSSDGIAINLGIDDGSPQPVHTTGSVSLNGQFENVIGSAFADQVIGNDQPNEIFGGPGDDSVVGSGGQDTLAGGEGDDTITGGDGGGDSIDGGSGDDTIISGDGDDDTIFGGPGDDSIQGSGGSDTLSGGEGNDTITGGDGGGESIEGGSGDDTITAGEGSDDTIFGGPGDDSIQGSGGNDTLVGGEGNDTITGGNNDSLPGAGGGESISGGIGDDTITSGDGANDTIFGGPGDDSIQGSGGNDTIDGGDGNDTIIGGGGSESIDGGSGDDTITSGEGSNDTIFGGPGDDSIQGSGGSDTIDGGEGDDSITGGDGGNESIDGGSGSDTITAGGGSGDTIFGGPGDDSIQGSGGSDTIDGGDGNDTITGGNGGSESIDGGSGDDTITAGGGSGDTIFGGPGDDSIQGSGGSDTIDGGDGNDTIIGGSGGNESIDGGAGDDTITAGDGPDDTIFGGPGDDSIQGSGGNDTINGGDGNDTIVGGSGGSESIDGGSGDDTITAGDGPDDTIFGGPGDDSIQGSGGSDTIDGGDGNDTIIGGSGGNESIDGGAGDDTITAGDGPDDTIFGGPGDDSIQGSGGTDTINGGDGNDTIVGGSGGNESIDGGSGDDTITAGDGPGDTIFGGPGDDSIQGSGGDDTLAGGEGNDSISGGDGGSESIDGGSGDDTITSGEGPGDTIFGGPGDDSIQGSGGDDTIAGGDGDDTIIGGAGGGESIDGGSGDDTITSGGGDDDTIFGAAGNDLIILGSGTVKVFGDDDDITTNPISDDRVMIQADADIRIATTAQANQATLTVNGVPVAELTDINAAILIGGAGNNRLDASEFLGDAGLVGAAGDDTLLGGIGNDNLEGGPGDDINSGGDGDDTYTFAGLNLGLDVIDEADNASNDTLDFFGLLAAVDVDLSAVGQQTVAPGNLQLELTGANTIENAIGTVFSDTLAGNDSNNKLVGGGGLDSVYGGAGDDYLTASRTRHVLLDFDSQTDGLDHVYTQSERDAIQARLEQDYGLFDVVIHQVPPVDEVFISIRFNQPRIVDGIPLPGGASSRIGFRDLERGGTVLVDVNAFLGNGENQLSPNEQNFIALSSTIASHELGHMYGLRHLDAFGSPGDGVFPELDATRLLPVYDGPELATETADHLISSPRSVRTTLTDALHDPYFGEREALKLAFGDTGEAIMEQPNANKTDAITIDGLVYPVQSIGALPALAVPNTIENPNAENYAVPLDAAAAAVIGHIDLDGDKSESDVFSFTGEAGQRVSIDVMSQGLRARIGNTIDALVRVYNASGQKLDYYGSPLGAFNDDGFEPTDSVLVDLILPSDGTYYVEVDTFNFFIAEFPVYQPDFDATSFCEGRTSDIRCADTDTGDYELLIYRFATGVSQAKGNLLAGGAGDDTLVGSSGNDIFLTDDGDTLAGPRPPAIRIDNHPPQLDPIPNQQVDESSPLQFTVSASDPDQGDVLRYRLLPAGDPSAFPSGAQIDPDTGTVTWMPQDDGVYQAIVEVFDLHGLTASEPVKITVANIDLDATITSITGELTEGSQITIYGAADDPSGDATTITLTYEVFRDGLIVATDSGIDLTNLVFTPDDDGAYEVRLTARGNSGQEDADQTTITVVNVAPAFNAGPDETLPPSAAGILSRSLQFMDPGNDQWTGFVNFGDSTTDVPLSIMAASKGFDLLHTYSTGGTYTVTVTLDDGDPGGVFVDSFQVTVVSNFPPQLDPQSLHIDENATTVGAVVATDPDSPADVLAFSITGAGPDDGKFHITSDGVLSFLVAPDYENPIDSGGAPADNVYLVEVQVTDVAGDSDKAVVSVLVDPVNESPIVANATDNVVASDDRSDDTVDLSIVFVDPDIQDDLTLTIVSNTNPNLVSASLVGETLTLVYPLDQSGIAEIIIRATDSDGLFAEDTLTVTVRSSSDLVQDIIDGLDVLVTSGVLASKNAKPLLSKLNGVNDKLSKGNYTPAANQMQAFVNQVNAFIHSGKLSAVDGGLLIESAENAIASIQSGSGSSLVAAISSQASVGDAGVPIRNADELLIATIGVSLGSDSSNITPDQHARFLDSLITLNTAFADYGVSLVELADPNAVDTQIHINIASHSPCGSADAGVLGCTAGVGEITLLDGWDWYVESNADAVIATQYDFQTIVTHELGHAIGLDHSDDVESVMNLELSSGTSRRDLTAHDQTYVQHEPDGDEPHTLMAMGLTLTDERSRRSDSILGPGSLPNAIEHDFLDDDSVQMSWRNALLAIHAGARIGNFNEDLEFTKFFLDASTDRQRDRSDSANARLPDTEVVASRQPLSEASVDRVFSLAGSIQQDGLSDDMSSLVRQDGLSSFETKPRTKRR